MTPEEFEALSPEKRAEAVAHNDENVRMWRATCQVCGASLLGTLADIRKHGEFHRGDDAK